LNISNWWRRAMSMTGYFLRSPNKVVFVFPLQSEETAEDRKISAPRRRHRFPFNKRFSLEPTKAAENMTEARAEGEGGRRSSGSPNDSQQIKFNLHRKYFGSQEQKAGFQPAQEATTTGISLPRELRKHFSAPVKHR